MARGEVCLPKLPPKSASKVDADQAVVVARRARADAVAELKRVGIKERLELRARELASCTLGIGMCAEIREDEEREGGAGDGGMEACLAQMLAASKVHICASIHAVDRKKRMSVNSFEFYMQGPQVLRFCPDLLLKTVNLLKN